MTFEEVVNSGCRFQNSEWNPFHKSLNEMWCYLKDDTVYWFNGDKFSPNFLIGYYEEVFKNNPEKMNSWVVHPEDQHKLDFNAKMKDLLRD